MHALLILACVVVAALGVPTNPPVTVATPDSFITLMKEVEHQQFFMDATTAFRVETFEILTAAQTNHLGPFLDRLGYVRLLKYLDALPKDYSHRFISYSIVHLQMEGYIPADHGMVIA